MTESWYRQRRSRKSWRSSRRPGTPERRLRMEVLERRLVLSAPACAGPDCLEVPLLAGVDQVGRLVDVVQTYEDAGGVRTTFSIFDTGAAVVAFSALDQTIFDALGKPIPIKISDGAHASGVGGDLVGDLSAPGLIRADGLHAWELNPENLLNSRFDLENGVQAENVQAFVGTRPGSSFLPTLAGTPLLNPSPTYPNGAAATIDPDAFVLDFGKLFPQFPNLKDVIIRLPDVQFSNPNPAIDLPDDGSVSELVRIPVELYGEDNHSNPGDELTTSWSPVQTDVAVYEGDHAVQHKTFLFDTGAQVSVISTEVATELGFDLSNPEFELSVHGAGGRVDIDGFTIDALDLPRDADGDSVADGTLRFTNAPVFVLDIGAGIDGILGTNLLNPASVFAYDPFDVNGPSVKLAFMTSRPSQGNSGDMRNAMDLLGTIFPTLAATQHDIRLPNSKHTTSWHNSVVATDVNNDGVVVPLDALLLINELNVHGSHQLTDPPIRSRPVQQYLDVNNDLMVTPLDALLVINRLNRAAGEAEGETAGNSGGKSAIQLDLPMVVTGTVLHTEWTLGNLELTTPQPAAQGDRTVPDRSAVFATPQWLELIEQPAAHDKIALWMMHRRSEHSAAVTDRALNELLSGPDDGLSDVL